MKTVLEALLLVVEKGVGLLQTSGYVDRTESMVASNSDP